MKGKHSNCQLWNSSCWPIYINYITLIINSVDNTKIILFKGMDAYSGEVLIKVWAHVFIGNHMISSAIWDK